MLQNMAECNHQNIFITLIFPLDQVNSRMKDHPLLSGASESKHSCRDFLLDLKTSKILFDLWILFALVITTHFHAGCTCIEKVDFQYYSFLKFLLLHRVFHTRIYMKEVTRNTEQNDTQSLAGLKMILISIQTYLLWNLQKLIGK